MHIVRNENYIGCIRSFEQCFRYCTGKIIISCDADDIWYPEKIKKIRECFDNPKVVYVWHDAIVVDAMMNEIEHSLNATWDHLENKEDREAIILRSIKRQGFPYGMTMAF